MVEATNLQQILSLSNAVERVQQVQQARGDEAARQFGVALEAETDQKRVETHQAEQAENAAIRQEQNRRRTIFRKGEMGKKEEQEEEDKQILKEVAEDSDHGKNINVVI